TELVVEVIAVDRGDGFVFLRKFTDLEAALAFARHDDLQGVIGQIDAGDVDVRAFADEFAIVDARRDVLPVVRARGKSTEEEEGEKKRFAGHIKLDAAAACRVQSRLYAHARPLHPEQESQHRRLRTL